VIQKDKIDFTRDYLDIEDGSYSDMIKEEISFQFFENGWVNNFVEQFDSKEEIKERIDLIVSKIVLHEDEAGLLDILESYMQN